MKKNQTIQAIMHTELISILKQTDQYEDVVNGFSKCECCGKDITLDNISTLIPYEDNGKIRVRFYCNQFKCLNNDK